MNQDFKCGTPISRPTSDLSCRNLSKHVANCQQKQKASKNHQNLATVGIKGTGDINPREVPQLCAEAARPFSALVDASHQAILHPTVIKHLPTRRVVLENVHMLYSAVQQNYKKVLQAHDSAVYDNLVVDVLQSTNGFDILGIVIYRLAKDDSKGAKLEATPLDFVHLS
ncbi:hypothetical protein PSTG_05623 [Puccinia striiformis f. sp. tritici PST-78]|uniref:Uncharacterized protein n=1 Tax=Puccinia striiformis f. sp. tritici PST-78 TaxID=1165861 RepID=A0A0L0VPR5_9BASI|nr:hypothetical protein PSTG_05623 [Puccinia striiformis f. sp. tritici PST-78]